MSNELSLLNPETFLPDNAERPVPWSLRDTLIQENEEVVFNAGKLDRSIFMKCADYFRVAKPRVAKIAARGETA